MGSVKKPSPVPQAKEFDVSETDDTIINRFAFHLGVVAGLVSNIKNTQAVREELFGRGLSEDDLTNLFETSKRIAEVFYEK